MLALCASGAWSSLDAQPTWQLDPDVCATDEAMGRRSWSPVGPLAVASDGTLFVGFPMEGVVRSFGQSGRLRSTIGGRGNGRGELMDVSELGVIGDSLYVVDHRLGRVSVFRTRGTFIGWATPSASDARLADHRPWRLLADGSLLYEPVARGEGGSSTGRESPVLRVGGSGRGVDTIAWLDPGAGRAALGGTATGTLVPRLYDDSPIVVFSHDGARGVVVERPAATSGRESSFRVTALSASGDTLFTRRHRYTPQRVDRHAVESFVAREAEHLAEYAHGTSQSRESVAEAVRASMRVPEWAPPVAGVLLGADGSVWLRQSTARADAPSRWTVLGGDGRVAATVETPANASLRWVGHGIAWSVEASRGGSCGLRRYRITGR